MPELRVDVSLDPKFHEKPRAFWLYRAEQEDGRPPPVSGLYIPRDELPDPPPRELRVSIEYGRALGFLQ